MARIKYQPNGKTISTKSQDEDGNEVITQEFKPWSINGKAKWSANESMGGGEMATSPFAGDVVGSTQHNANWNNFFKRGAKATGTPGIDYNDAAQNGSVANWNAQFNEKPPEQNPLLAHGNQQLQSLNNSLSERMKGLIAKRDTTAAMNQPLKTNADGTFQIDSKYTPDGKPGTGSVSRWMNQPSAAMREKLGTGITDFDKNGLAMGLWKNPDDKKKPDLNRLFATR